MQEILNSVTQKYLKKRVPEFNIGDTVRVLVKVREGEADEKTRLQAYEGVVISRAGGGINDMVTVRRMTHGVGIERTFPVHSPNVDDIQVVRHGRVRRAKLYYLRTRVGKKARVKEQSRDTVYARQEAARVLAAQYAAEDAAEAAAAAAAQATEES